MKKPVPTKYKYYQINGFLFMFIWDEDSFEYKIYWEPVKNSKMEPCDLSELDPITRTKLEQLL